MATEYAISRRFLGLRVGEPHQFEWLKGVIASVFVLNVLDGALTLFWVLTGQAVEANPLMAELINTHELLFMLAKLTLVGLGSAVLWHLREHGLAVLAIFTGFFAYYGLLLFHLHHMKLDLLGG